MTPLILSQPKTGTRTQDVLLMVAAKLSLASSGQEGSNREIAELRRTNQLLKAVLLPDPLPRAVQLSLVADSSSCEMLRNLLFLDNR